MAVVRKIVPWMKNNSVPLILGFLMLLTVLLGAWETAEVGLYDTWFRVRGPIAPGKDIVLITMDERSMSQLGPLPWPRQIHAALLSRLSHAKMICFAVVFDSESNELDDSSLLGQISKHGNVILGSYLMPQAPGGVLPPWEPLAAQSSGSGFINLPSDRGNVVRRFTVLHTSAGQVMPSFGLASVIELQRLKPTDIRLLDGRITIGSRSFAVNEQRQLMMNYWGPTGTFPSYSYIDILNGQVDPAVFKDAVVLLGPFSPTEQADAYQTPFTRGNMILSSGAPTPGVEIQASIIKTLLSGGSNSQAPQWVDLLVLLAAWLVVFQITRRTSPWIGFGLAALLTFGLGAAAYFSWLKLHIWIAAVAPITMVGVCYIGITIDNFIRVELERRKTRAVFSRYLAASVVDQIMASGGEIELGGVKQEVTIMLVDIRGFTAFSENKDPQDVLARLNQYLTAMTRIIHKYNGTLDKYTGDGLMAFFGAPVPLPDHADRAVRVAIEIEEKIGELNETWVANGGVPLLVAVGLNTGVAVVGNVGSPERMDYTLLGDDVGLASDMEGSSKRLQTLIVVSEKTYNKLQDESLKTSLVRVGEEPFKDEEIGCYTVTTMDLHFEKSTDKGFK
ncbi:MAG: CHASE2 domain-containing protein [Solirubrobacterales bacterium]